LRCPSDSEGHGAFGAHYVPSNGWETAVEEAPAASQAALSDGDPENDAYAQACMNYLLGLPISYFYPGYAVSTCSQFKNLKICMARYGWSGYPPVAADEVVVTPSDIEVPGCERELFALKPAPPDATPSTPPNISWHTEPMPDAFSRSMYNGNPTGGVDMEAWDAFDIVLMDDDGALRITNGFSHPRLREGISRFFITDINNPASSVKAASGLPTMMDAFGNVANPGMGFDGKWGANSTISFNHIPGGCNVMFMDGHVEFIKWDSDFPIKVPDNVCWANFGDVYSSWVNELIDMGGWG
jgi:prepilin-type processing-associated H-X9-DG protein